QSRRGDRMTLGHVRAGAENHVRFRHIRERIGHSSSADGGRQTDDRGAVSSPAAVIDLLRPEAGATERLHRVGRLVWSPPAGDAINAASAILCQSAAKPFCRDIERFVPCGFFEVSVRLPHEGLLQAVFMLHKIEGELALDTKSAVICWTVHGGVYAYES